MIELTPCRTKVLENIQEIKPQLVTLEFKNLSLIKLISATVLLML